MRLTRSGSVVLDDFVSSVLSVFSSLSSTVYPSRLIVAMKFCIDTADAAERSQRKPIGRDHGVDEAESIAVYFIPFSMYGVPKHLPR